jgi:hypothetical protein
MLRGMSLEGSIVEGVMVFACLKLVEKAHINLAIGTYCFLDLWMI